MIKVNMEFPQINNYRMVEGLNQLKINLSFCGKDIRIIMVTSTNSGEGKSSVSVRFAQSLSENGKRVVLVDCDLRKSVMVAQYHIQGLEKGMSHYLSGQAELEDIIYATDNPSFFIVPAGPHTLDPTNLLDSDTFREFIEAIKEGFDYIILDVPPLGLVMDAAIIGQCADGTLIVIEQGKIKRKLAQNVVKQLNRSNIRILGAVLNKVDEKSREYSSYNYNYSADENIKKIRFK